MTLDIPRRVLLLAALVGSLAACRRAPESPTAPTSADQEAGSIEVVDGLGRTVVLSRPAERIVSLAPSNTEILHAIGAGDRIVGGTILDNYPPEALSHAKIGGMTPRSINLEAIVALKPDLVLATGGVQQPIVEPLERLGLTVAVLDAEDFAGVARNFRAAGRLTGRVEEAERLASEFLGRVEAVGRRVAERTSPRPRVLFLVGEDPPTTAGPRTFIGQMIEAAGGVNIFGDVDARYPRPSEEEILVRAPEVILASRGAMNADSPGDDDRRLRIRSRPGWDRLPAVRQGRIAFLDEDQITRAGPRLVEGLEAMAEALGTGPMGQGEGASSE